MFPAYVAHSLSAQQPKLKKNNFVNFLRSIYRNCKHNVA